MLQSFASKRGKLVAQRGQTESERSHGTVHKAFRRVAALCIPLLRPNRQLFERIVSAGASGRILHRRGDPWKPRLCRVTLPQAQANAWLQAPQGGDAFNRSGFSWPLGLPRPAGPAGRSGSRRIRVLFAVIAAHSNYEPKSSLNPGLRSGVYQESSLFC